ncbi:MAG: hypothetical protein SFW07_03780, partial [Gammaproteobacteria bacterium]|nr:hypothetical protein [Gammaproteobacteria bacterium]
MFDPAPQAATFTTRIRLSDFWEWFKSLFSRKQASHLNMNALDNDPADTDDLNVDTTADGSNSATQIATALRPKNDRMEMGSPLTPGKDAQNPWESDDENPSVVEMTAKNWLFSKLAALVLAIGEFIKNAANAIREHVESSSKQYKASVEAYGPTP